MSKSWAFYLLNLLFEPGALNDSVKDYETLMKIIWICDECSLFYLKKENSFIKKKVNQNYITSTIMAKGSPLLNQFQHENETWKRVLEFLKDENIILKNQLSGILPNIAEADDGLMEKIEYFQNHFVKEDEIIRLLRIELSEQGKLLVREMYEDGDVLKEVKHTQKKLRKEFEFAELHFNKLKYEFNDYLAEILNA